MRSVRNVHLGGNSLISAKRRHLARVLIQLGVQVSTFELKNSEGG